MSDSLSFILRFCRNWDGGEQERDTALSCLKSIFPDADIKIYSVNKYPIQVTIEAVLNGNKMRIWKGRQQDLFSKYATKRKETMEIIKENLRIFQEEMIEV